MGAELRVSEGSVLTYRVGRMRSHARRAAPLRQGAEHRRRSVTIDSLCSLSREATEHQPGGLHRKRRAMNLY